MSYPHWVSSLSMSYPHLYWVFASNLLQYTLYGCRLSIDPLKVRGDLGNLKPAANIRNHDFGNLVFEEGHKLSTIYSHQLCYQHFTMKSSLERINIPNTKRSELLETKLQIIDLFNDIYENKCRPNWGLVDKEKNRILKKENNIE